MKYAIIDVGSNSIRYMDRRGKRLVTTRLAEGLAESGRLSPAAIQRSLDAISEFADHARFSGLYPVAYATSAVRDAKNGPAFAGMVRSLGIDIEVLPGELEAKLAYLGAAGEGGLLDIGGGSCQLIWPGFAKSWPLGCVRAKELCPGNGSVEELREGVFSLCRERLSLPPPAPLPRWTGVGGTVTTLSALTAGLTHYDPKAVEAARLTQESLAAIISELYEMGDRRAAHPLLRERHDVILYGALILLYIMESMEIGSLHASDKDGMEGYYLYISGKSGI